MLLMRPRTSAFLRCTSSAEALLMPTNGTWCCWNEGAGGAAEAWRMLRGRATTGSSGLSRVMCAPAASAGVYEAGAEVKGGGHRSVESAEKKRGGERNG